MTTKHMARRDTLLWPTQTIFPEIHIWKTPPAAKAKKETQQRVDTQKEQYAMELCCFKRRGRQPTVFEFKKMKGGNKACPQKVLGW